MNVIAFVKYRSETFCLLINFLTTDSHIRLVAFLLGLQNLNVIVMNRIRGDEDRCNLIIAVHVCVDTYFDY